MGKTQGKPSNILVVNIQLSMTANHRRKKKVYCKSEPQKKKKSMTGKKNKNKRHNWVNLNFLFLFGSYSHTWAEGVIGRGSAPMGQIRLLTLCSCIHCATGASAIFLSLMYLMSLMHCNLGHGPLPLFFFHIWTQLFRPKIKRKKKLQIGQWEMKTVNIVLKVENVS